VTTSPAATAVTGLGQRAGARRVMLTHHKPGRTDDALDRLASRVAAGPADVIVAARAEIVEF
jgi:phosphoribosyl 1,2-cyclic phosphodiesterase